MSTLDIILLEVYSLCLLFIFCYSLTQLHLTFLYWRSKKNKPESEQQPQNRVALNVQLPVYNDRYVVERLLDAALALTYFKRGISFLTLSKGILTLYFAAGIVLTFKLKDFGLLPFHVMLVLGFGIVFIYSLLHSRHP